MLLRRKYSNYGAYLRHQRSKLPRLLRSRWGKGFEKRRRAFVLRLGHIVPVFEPEGSVLCLGARLGEEVAAFRVLGYDAVGIDLNPGPNNKLVFKADFHRLPFRDRCFDFLYTNSLDHALDIKKVARECKRVLKAGGRLVVEIGTAFDKLNKRKHLAKRNAFESVLWERDSDLIDLLEGFRVVSPFTKNPHADYRSMIMEVAS